MRLRPHHIIDIITDFGNDIIYQPHPYGHSQHLVAPVLLSDLDKEIKLVLDSDDICKGCRHLLQNGRCDDVLGQLVPSPSKEAYNDVLDCRLFDRFLLSPGSVLTTRKYLEIVNSYVPGLENICTHPKEDSRLRIKGLADGLFKLGIRKSD